MVKNTRLKVTDGKNEKFNKKLKEKGYKKKDLAVDAGITPQTMSKIANGKNTGVENALKMAKIIGCSVEDLFELEEINETFI